MDNQFIQQDQLRKNAEALLSNRISTDITPLSADKLLHELQVHQIELEMQNDELRRAQVALEQSRDRYVDLYEFSPEGYLTINSNGMIDEANLTGAALLRVERKMLINRRFSGFVSSEDRDKWHIHFLNMLKNDGHQTIELKLNRNDGSNFYARIDCLRKESNNIASVRIAFSDITEQHRSIEIQREQFEEIEDLYNNAACGYHSLDKDGVICRINDTELRWLGYTREEVVGKIKFADLLSPVDAQKFLQNYPRLQVEKSISDIECEIIRKNGTALMGLVNATAIHDSNGNYVMSRTTVVDITARKKLEETVISNEKQFRLLVESIPQLVWITRPDGWSIYFNQQWMDYTGLSAEDSYGYDWNKVLHPEDQIIAWNTWQFSLNNKCAFSLESRLLRADGEYRWWLMRGVPVHDELGNVYKWFCTGTDINDIKKAEQELQAAAIKEREITAKNIQLTQEVSRRNAELSDLAAHAQQIAETERANLARELHDEMGSILTGLNMEVGRLSREVSDPDLLQDLSRIKELISNASSIKQNIINQLYPTILDDFGFVHAINWLVKEYRKHSGIAVELAVAKDEIVIEHSIALAAYRITQECLTNIAKHSGASEVHIELKVSDGLLDLTIHDNGKGMPEEISVNRHGIIGMIERSRYLGGSMKIGSEDGKGTTAHLTLPLAFDTPQSRKRVLVVDDHELVRNAIRQLLESQTDDFSVAGEAADGKRAIEMAIEGEWDVMLLDINLPKKNGIKVLEKLREAKPNLPIVMLSSHAEEEYGEIARSKRGGWLYCEK